VDVVDLELVLSALKGVVMKENSNNPGIQNDERLV